MEKVMYKGLFAVWSIPTALLTCGALVWTYEFVIATNDIDNFLSFMMMCFVGFGALIFLTIDALLLGKARQ